MNARRSIALLLLAVLMVAVFGFYAVRLREPLFEGRGLSDWLDRSAEGKPVDVERADEAVRQVGVNAIPVLLRFIQAKESSFREKIHDLLVGQNWIHFRYATAWEKQSAGIRGLAILGPKAEAAVPKLAELLRHESTALSASAALSAIPTEAAVQALLQAMENQSRNINWAAQNALIQMARAGVLGNDSLTLLTQAATSENPSARMNASLVLRAANLKDAELAIPLLLPRLRHTQPEIRLAAAGLLAFHGARPDLVVPALIERLDDREAGVRAAAADFLGQMRALPDLTVPSLLSKLEDADPGVRSSLVEALSKFADQRDRILPKVQSLTNDSDIEVRKAVARTGFILSQP